MTQNAVIAGTFADLKTVKSRSVVQMVIEVPIERGEQVVQMFGFPQPGAEIAVAVARLATEQPKSSTPTTGRKWDELRPSQQAGIACADPEFWQFLTEVGPRDLNIANDKAAADEVRFRCDVSSRRYLDTDEDAASRWNVLHGEFRKWRADRMGQEQAEAQAAYARR